VTERALTFNRALREIAVPKLSEHGFKFDSSRTFRRLSSDQRFCEIINFQLGQRSKEGEFTVNLGVFREGDSQGILVSHAQEHECSHGYRIRIGAIIPIRFPKLYELPIFGFLFGSKDKWWQFSSSPLVTNTAVSSAVNVLLAHGMGWFAEKRAD
jgi:hypothetical protein